MKLRMAVFLVLSLCHATARADVSCSLDDPASLQAAGGRIVGSAQFVPGKKNSGLRLGTNAYVTFPAAGHFNPRQGTVEFWVQPLWDANDKQDHTFFHLGGAESHCTIFRTSAGTLRFVYKSDPAHYAARDVDVRSWKRSEWHHVQASWMPTYSGLLLLILRIDGQPFMQSGATPFSQPPRVFFLGRRGPDLQPAEAALDEFRLSTTPLNPPFAIGPKEPVAATVDATRARPLRRVHDFTTIWNNRENPLPFCTADAYFRRFTEAGFKMARLVAFSEAWLWGTRVELGPKGELLTDFRDFDNLLDMVFAAGAEPYIRLAYHTPSALVAPGLPPAKRHYALPQDLQKWDELMQRIVRHVRLERKLPVRYWVAALNEGDIPVRAGFADFETVNSLYERTVRIVKRLDPEAKVGGPALARSTGPGEPLLRSFLRYCRERKLPLDFICFHAYRLSHPREYEETLNEIRRIATEEWPEQAPHLEYFMDEWNLWHQDGTQDNEYGASYLAAALHYQRRAGLTKSSIVSFNHFMPTKLPAKELVTHQGPFDKSGANVVRFLPSDLNCEGVTRRGILAHPPGQPPGASHCYTYGAFRLTVPSKGRPRLHVATGIASTYPRCDGCGFAVVVRQGDEERTLWREFQPTRSWREREVSLAEYAGREIIVEFRTDSGPRGNASGDWASWGEPRLIVDGETGKAQTVFDFIEHAKEVTAGARQPAWRFVYNDETIQRYSGLPLLKGPVVTTPYFVWAMHNRLGGEELAVDLPGRDGILTDDSGGLTATRSEKGIVLLLWHFDLMRNESRKWTVRLTNLPEALRRPATLRLTEHRIDHDHTNPYTDYVLKGKDPQAGRYNLETGALDKVRTEQVSVQNGAAAVQIDLPNLSVALLQIESSD